MDLGPLAQDLRTRVRVGLFGPALACNRCLYQSVSLSALPSKGRVVSPEVPIRGRMIQVVLLVVWTRLGGGDGDLDHTDGVVCF